MSGVLGDSIMLCRGRIGPQAPLMAPRRDASGRNRRAVAGVTILTILSLAVSGCAVGPNFSPAAAPEVDGYLPGKLASPDPGHGGARVAGQHFVSRAGVSARWWSAFKSPLLNRLLKPAVAQNPNLQATQAGL